MKNRRQMTPGAGGDPNARGPAARTAFPASRDRMLTDVAHEFGACVNDIGRAGRSGHFSS